MKLKEITISGFRGFNEKQTMNLNNKMILVKGSNGSGKSSLVEAIEWFFFDDISRKRKSLCKSEYTGEFLRNIHCKKEQETFVELLIETGNKETLLKKTLISAEKKTYYINGSLVDGFSELGVSFAEVYKPILSQVEVKHYVETEPKDRYEETNKILGLGILSEFRSDLQELQKSKKAEEKYQTCKKFYHGLEGDLKELALEKLWGAIERRPFSALGFESQFIKILTETYSIEPKPIHEIGRILDEELRKLAQKSDSAITPVTMFSDKNVMGLPAKVIEETRKLFTLMEQLKPINAELYRFLEAGKNLIEDTSCPFCNEKTITSEKIKEIDERIKATKDAETLLTNISSKTSDLTNLKDDFNRQYIYILNTVTVEKVRSRIVDKLNFANELAKIDLVTEQVELLKRKIATFNNAMDVFLEETRNATKGKSEFNKKKCDTEVNSADESAKSILQDLKKLNEDMQSVMSLLVSKAPDLSNSEKQELKRYILFRKIIDHFDEIEYVGIYENNLNCVSGLIQEVEKFEKTKSEKQLSGLNETIKRFYERLNPDEKTQFAEIQSKGNSRKIQIKAVSHGKDMNPVSCFSEAHMNCLCLSIYFSQRVLNNPYWDFVVLDDPVQSMDEDHGKNLIRILDEVHSNKQVIITSHNARFCQDFKELFYGRDYLFYEFSGNSIEGPNIDLKKASFKNRIEVAKKYYNGNSEEREISGNHLRKAIERLTADILIQKASLSHKRVDEMKLEERLEKLETSKILAVPELGEIKAMLKICDSASHEKPEREVTSTELLDGISTLEAIYSKHLGI